MVKWKEREEYKMAQEKFVNELIKCKEEKERKGKKMTNTKKIKYVVI